MTKAICIVLFLHFFCLSTPAQAFSALLKREEYHRYNEVKNEIEKLRQRYPDWVRVDLLGQSAEGRDLIGVEITDHKNTDLNKPAVLYVGGMHALEVTTIEVLLRFMQVILKNTHHQEIRQLLTRSRLYFVPMSNPDGMEYFYNGQILHKNNGKSRAVDLNRNFAYQWGFDDEGSNDRHGSWGYRGTHAFSEAESRALRDLVLQKKFVFSLSYHSHGEQFLYPWNYQRRNPQDLIFYQHYAGMMAEAAGYRIGNPANGEIYLSNGDFDDWMYSTLDGKNSTLAMTVEIGSFFAYAPAIPVQPHYLKTLFANLLMPWIAEDPAQIMNPTIKEQIRDEVKKMVQLLQRPDFL